MGLGFFSNSVCYGDTRLETQEERPVPDYDGRAPADPSTGEVLLWVPRVVFFPAYLVTEYLIRTPLNWFGRAAELNSLPLIVVDFFTFGEDQRYGLFPSILVDFGFRTSFGLNFYMKRFLSDQDRLSISAATAGQDWINLSVNESLPIGENLLEVGGGFLRRPDYIFHGLGPSTTNQARTRYQAETLQAQASYRYPLMKNGALRFELGLRDASFSGSQCCDEPDITDFIRRGRLGTPPRFDTGYTALRQRVDFQWGNAPSRPEEPIGGRTILNLEHAFDVSGNQNSRWVLYGAMVQGYWNIWKDRVISVSLDTQFSDSLGDRSVPFFELPTLGGDRPLPGFLEGRLVGESAAAFTFEYTWPIQAFIDGVFHYGLGNVFDKGLKNFRLGLLRQSVGLGMQVGSGDSFGFLLAAGSRTIEEGAGFNNFRVQLRFISEL